MCHTVYPFIHTSLLGNVHCKESLKRLQASGVCYTISTGSSPGLLLDGLLMPCDMKILHVWILQLQKLQKFIDMIDVGMDWVSGLDLELGGNWTGLQQPHHQGESSSTTLSRSSNTAASRGQNQLSCSHAFKASSILLPRWGAGSNLSSAAASEVQGQLFSSCDLGASSPTCHRWQGARGGYLSLTHATVRQTSGRLALPGSWLQADSPKSPPPPLLTWKNNSPKHVSHSRSKN